MVRNTREWGVSAKSCSLASKGREKGNPSPVYQLRGKGRVRHSKHNEAKTAWSYPQMIFKWVICLRSNCSVVVIRYCRREDNGREGSVGVVLQVDRRHNLGALWSSKVTTDSRIHCGLQNSQRILGVLNTKKWSMYKAVDMLFTLIL